MAYDQANRSVWLAEQLWPRIRDAFPLLQRLPREALVTVGYPSSGARGRSDKIKPAEVNYQWHGNDNEKVFISVHPVYFDNPLNVARAITFGAAKFHGARWGAQQVGIHKETDGTLTCTAECTAKLEAIIKDAGDVPPGFGVAFPVRSVQRARLRKYVAGTAYCMDSNGDFMHDADNSVMRHAVIRAASDTLNVACAQCQVAYKLV